MMSAPTIGRHLHYVTRDGSGNVCRTAVVTEVNDTGRSVGLAVLHPTELEFVQDVQRNEYTPTVGTWHWPCERRGAE